MPPRQKPTPPPPPVPADPPRYRVVASALGFWLRGEVVTDAELGGPERTAVLIARGAIVRVEE